jgi:hypothetical protein
VSEQSSASTPIVLMPAAFAWRRPCSTIGQLMPWMMIASGLAASAIRNAFRSPPPALSLPSAMWKLMPIFFAAVAAALAGTEHAGIDMPHETQ